MTYCLLRCTYRAHRIETDIYKLDNSISPDLNHLSLRVLLWFGLEFLVYAVHPLTYFPGVDFFSAPALYYLALLRCPYLIRFVVSQSMVCENITLNTISKLININMTTMTLESWRLVWRRFAAQIIGCQVIGIWILGAWVLRLAEARYAVLTCTCAGDIDYSFEGI